jgi:periplasmic protein TonB
MSVGDIQDIERTGEFAVTLRRPSLRRPRANPGASGSVPIAVLTDDAVLADAVHDAAGAAHPVAVASTLDEAVELAADGRCSILIIDQLSSQQALRRTMQRLREAEPALVVIAVGESSEQSGLINLLSAGVVDRLMLKPVSPSLAQIVLKSAVQQHRTLQSSGTAVTVLESQSPQREPALVLIELQRHAANELNEAGLDLQPASAEVLVPASIVSPAPPSRRIQLPQLPWIAIIAAFVAVAGVISWMASNRKPAIDPQAVIASTLVAAQRAFNDGHALEPRGRSALDHYRTILALDPSNAAARQGIDQIADRYAAQAGIAIARGEVAAAIVALEGIRRARPDHRQLSELQEQLEAAQNRLAAAAAKALEPIAQPPAPKAVRASTPPATSRVNFESQARAMAQAAEALKRDRLELASAQKNFDAAAGLLQTREIAGDSARAEAAEVPLATAHQPQEAPVTAGIAVAAAPVAAAPPSPRLTRVVRPEYPQDALIVGAEGWVDVSMSVTPAGDVRDPRVEASSSHRLFDRAALAVVRKWKYERSSATDLRRVTVRVDFRLKDKR